MIYQFNSKSQVTKNPASHHVCQVHTRVSRYTQACTWSPTRSALIHGTPATALQSVGRQERRFGAQQGVNAQPRECTASDVGSDKNSYIYLFGSTCMEFIFNSFGFGEIVYKKYIFFDHWLSYGIKKYMLSMSRWIRDFSLHGMDYGTASWMDL